MFKSFYSLHSSQDFCPRLPTCLLPSPAPPRPAPRSPASPPGHTHSTHPSCLFSSLTRPHDNAESQGSKCRRCRRRCRRRRAMHRPNSWAEGRGVEGGSVGAAIPRHTLFGAQGRALVVLREKKINGEYILKSAVKRLCWKYRILFLCKYTLFGAQGCALTDSRDINSWGIYLPEAEIRFAISCCAVITLFARSWSPC